VWGSGFDLIIKNEKLKKKKKNPTCNHVPQYSKNNDEIKSMEKLCLGFFAVSSDLSS
jgi:hypothetical protein